MKYEDKNSKKIKVLINRHSYWENSIDQKNFLDPLKQSFMYPYRFIGNINNNNKI